MKKIILLLFAIIYANVALSQHWGFGPKVGLNVSEFTGDGKYRSRIDAGFSGEYRMKNVAVEADLIYSKLGEKFDYLILPVKAKFYIFKGLNIFVGPQLDFFMGQVKFVPSVGGEVVPPSPRRFSLSAMGGVGYKLKNGFSISAAYSHGLMDVYPDTNTRTSRFHITLGWDIFQTVRNSK